MHKKIIMRNKCSKGAFLIISPKKVNKLFRKSKVGYVEREENFVEMK